MIVDVFLNWALVLMSGWISVLPVWSIDLTGLSGLTGYLAWVGGWIDLPAMGAGLALVVSVEVVLWGARLIVWIYEHIPVVGG